MPRSAGMRASSVSNCDVENTMDGFFNRLLANDAQGLLPSPGV